MVKIPKSFVFSGLKLFSLLCISSGLALYVLSDIPFGVIFQAVFSIFCFSMILTFVFLALICLKSEKRLPRIFGCISSFLAVIVLVFSLILMIDYRMLYFKSISPRPSDAEWIEDVQYLSNQLITKHPNLYSLVSEEKMTATVKEIEEQIPDMSTADILMSLFKITALPNDGHTFPFVMIPAFDLHSFPFKVYLFPEGLFIVDAGREYKHLVGSRIIGIGSANVQDIYENYSLFLATENNASYKERFTYMVMMAEWLSYHGIINDTDQAEFLLLKPNGEKAVLTIPSVNFYQHFLWSSLNTIENEAPPVFTNYRKDYYHYKIFDDKKTLYIQFNLCKDQPGRKTMAEFTAELKKTVTSSALERCIVDLRNNDGGSPVWNDLLEMLKSNQTFNQPGHLFVLIGRRTFSSAVILATRLQLQTTAIFVGESTGQGPGFFSRPNLIELPHSRLPFSISREFRVAGLPFDKRKAIYPDVWVEYSISDFLKGSDPVLNAALTYESNHKSAMSVSPEILDRHTGRYLLTPTQIMDITTENNMLKLHLSDFLAANGFEFESELYPITPVAFSTHIKNVKVEFPGSSGDRPDSVILNWMGVQQTLKAVSPEYTTAFERFSMGEIKSGCELLLGQTQVYMDTYPDLESIINRLGYVHLRKGKVSEAMQMFRVNVQLFPSSYNVYDSYGESLMVNNQNQLAIENYRKSLELNPNNKNAERVIQVLLNQ